MFFVTNKYSVQPLYGRKMGVVEVVAGSGRPWRCVLCRCMWTFDHNCKGFQLVSRSLTLRDLEGLHRKILKILIYYVLIFSSLAIALQEPWTFNFKITTYHCSNRDIPMATSSRLNRCWKCCSNNGHNKWDE